MTKIIINTPQASIDWERQTETFKSNLLKIYNYLRPNGHDGMKIIGPNECIKQFQLIFHRCSGGGDVTHTPRGHHDARTIILY